MGDLPDAFNMEELQNVIDHESIGEIPYWEKTDSTKEYMRLLEILEKSVVYDQAERTFGKLEGITDILFNIADMQMPYRDILDKVKKLMVERELVDSGASINQVLHQLSDFLIDDEWHEEDQDLFDIAHEIASTNSFAAVAAAKTTIKQFVRETIHFHNWVRRMRRHANI